MNAGCCISGLRKTKEAGLQETHETNVERGKTYMVWLYRYPPRIFRGLAEIFKRMGGNFAAAALSGWGSFWSRIVFPFCSCVLAHDFTGLIPAILAVKELFNFVSGRHRHYKQSYVRNALSCFCVNCLCHAGVRSIERPQNLLLGHIGFKHLNKTT